MITKKRNSLKFLKKVDRRKRFVKHDIDRSKELKEKKLNEK